MSVDKIEIRMLVNNQLIRFPAEPCILGDQSEKPGDPFTGIVLGAVQLGHRKWQFVDLVSGHRFHHQKVTYRSPAQGLKALENDIRKVRFTEGMDLKDIARKSWLFAWYGGLPLLVNPVTPHLPTHIIFDDTPHMMVARPCPRCQQEDWKIYSEETKPEDPEEDWNPYLGLECRSCKLRGEDTSHGIPHAMYLWNMAEWDENWNLK